MLNDNLHLLVVTFHEFVTTMCVGRGWINVAMVLGWGEEIGRYWFRSMGVFDRIMVSISRHLNLPPVQLAV